MTTFLLCVFIIYSGLITLHHVYTTIQNKNLKIELSNEKQKNSFLEFDKRLRNSNCIVEKETERKKFKIIKGGLNDK